METLILPFFNFSILVGLLYWKLKAPAKEFVAQRSVDVGAELRKTAEQLATAQKQLAEFSAKLKSVEAEVQQLRSEAKTEAARIQERTLNEAKRLADQVVRDANSRKESLILEAKGKLATDLALKVVDRAEALLKGRLTGDDRARLRKEFSNQLERLQ
jgi:F0F1-type ATP synthase membrane subunit b/b'